MSVARRVALWIQSPNWSSFHMDTALETTTKDQDVELSESQLDSIESQNEEIIIDAEEAHKIPSLPHPFKPLTETYSYHSPKPTATGPYMLGVDEAEIGRAHV